MPRRVRVAILGDCPCDQCTAACCRQNGHDYAAILSGDEIRKFAAFSVDAPIRDGERVIIEKVLPYVNGRCQFLGEDNRCAIYDDRPAACSAFECLSAFHEGGIGVHGTFLQRNPRVRELLESL